MAPSKPRYIPISKLELDLENYRLDLIALDQTEALELIFEESGPKIYALAKDIKESGMLNPIDLMLVIKNGDKFTVLEGNRRLAALRGLRSPKLVPEEFRPQFQRLHAGYASILRVMCVEVDDFSEAYRWVEMKHSGPGKGQGTVPWGANGRDNFSARTTGRRTYAQALFALMNKWYGDDQVVKTMIDTVRHGDHFTNLTRLLQDSYVRGRLGLQWDGTNISVAFTSEQLRPFFVHLFTSLTTEIKKGSKQPAWSRAWARSTDREQWLNSRSELLPNAQLAKSPAPKIDLPDSHSERSGRRSNATPGNKEKETKSTAPKPKPEPKVLDTKGIRVHDDFSLGVRRLFEEFQAIEYKVFPNITLDALRTLIEKSIKNYARLQNDRVPGKVLKNGSEGHAQFRDCLDWLTGHYQQFASKKHLVPSVNQLKGKAGRWPVTAEIYNGANHNDAMLVDREMVKAAWESIHPVMSDMLTNGPAHPAT